MGEGRLSRARKRSSVTSKRLDAFVIAVYQRVEQFGEQASNSRLFLPLLKLLDFLITRLPFVRLRKTHFKKEYVYFTVKRCSRVSTGLPAARLLN